MLLEKLGIFGWSTQAEDALLASLVTGDPLLMIGKRGSAKTQAANAFATSMGYSAICYDASKALFEDVLGFPNTEKLKQGIMEYVGSDLTLWDKDFCVIDELNRANMDMQNRWLEIIRSRKVMGKETSVKWVWAAMNPESYAGANTLDESMVDRFAWFIFPPDALELSESARALIAASIGTDDAPALSHWVDFMRENREDAGVRIREIVEIAANMMVSLLKDFSHAQEFIGRYAMLINQNSSQDIELTGRRLCFTFRNIISYRAVQLAKSMVYDLSLPSIKQSVKESLVMTLPALDRECRTKYASWSDASFETLGNYFQKGGDIELANRAYTILTTADIDVLIHELLQGGFEEIIKHRAWLRLLDGVSFPINKATLRSLANLALRMEALRPGLIPAEMIASLGEKLESSVTDQSHIDMNPEILEVIDRINIRWGKTHSEIAELCRSLAINIKDPKAFEERAFMLGETLDKILGEKS